MTKEKIARINELAHKSKTVGLTEAEKTEQQALRKEYIEDMKSSLRAQLERTSIKELDGTIHKVSKRTEGGGKSRTKPLFPLFCGQKRAILILELLWASARSCTAENKFPKVAYPGQGARKRLSFEKQ